MEMSKQLCDHAHIANKSGQKT